MLGIVPRIQAAVLNTAIVQRNEKLHALLAHPAGPFTIHFVAPSFKWMITLSNLSLINADPNTLSVPQQIAVTATGLIWSRYGLYTTHVH